MNTPALTRAQARAVDRLASERFGLSGLVLMENAGLLATLAILEEELSGGEVAVLCGGGNNGGDGYVIARQLANRGERAVCYATHPAARLRGDAAINRGIVDRMGLEVVDLQVPGALEACGHCWDRAVLLVDALLGTGFEGSVRDPLATVIERVNAAETPVVAIDLPSGLDADTGAPANATVRASRTLTFVAPKPGFEAPGAAAYTGEVTVIPIGVPSAAIAAALEEF